MDYNNFTLEDALNIISYGVNDVEDISYEDALNDVNDNILDLENSNNVLDLLTSMESNGITMEGSIGDWFKKAWEAIVNWAKEFATKVQIFFQTKSIKETAEKYKKIKPMLGNILHGNSPSDEFDIEVSTYKYTKDCEKYLRGLTKIRKIHIPTAANTGPATFKKAVSISDIYKILGDTFITEVDLNNMIEAANIGPATFKVTYKKYLTDLQNNMLSEDTKSSKKLSELNLNISVFDIVMDTSSYKNISESIKLTSGIMKGFKFMNSSPADMDESRQNAKNVIIAFRLANDLNAFVMKAFVKIYRDLAPIVNRIHAMREPKST